MGSELATPGPVSGEAWDGSRWSREDVGRVALLLLALKKLPEAQHLELLEDLYFRGSMQEKRAVLLALPFAPDRQRFVELAVEACRTNAVSVFEALACENTFPGEEFTDPQFNQLVLKTMFLGLEAQRILGVQERLTQTLVRMVKDFENERRAAGRPVPSGIPWIVEMAEGTS